jgi:hypothetical protein
MHAMVRARIPYLPVHIDDVAASAQRFSLLILPNLGALSDAQCEALRQHVNRGGSLLATGATSLYNEWGDARPDYGLADVFGVHASGAAVKLPSRREGARRGAADRFAPDGHTYLTRRSRNRTGPGMMPGWASSY